jgi:hypothetical protein
MPKKPIFLMWKTMKTLDSRGFQRIAKQASLTPFLEKRVFRLVSVCLLERYGFVAL